MRTVNDTYSNLRTKQGVKSKINIVNLFGLMGYAQAGQGRTYAEKVDAGPLVAYLLHLQTFSSFGGFQVFKF